MKKKLNFRTERQNVEIILYSIYMERNYADAQTHSSLIKETLAPEASTLPLDNQGTLS